MNYTNKIIGNILGNKPKTDKRSKNSGKDVKVGGKVTRHEYDTIKTWFENRFPDSSFQEFVTKTKLEVKK